MTTPNTDGSTTDPLAGQPLGKESSLSNWAGPYVTDMLGRGQALSEQPYQAYGGPLTAGSSPLQNQAFGGIAGLAMPTGIADANNTMGDVNTALGNLNYDPNTFTTGAFTDPGVANAYMSPYMSNVLDPQMDEIRRQAEITRQRDNAGLTRAGAFGGSRQAIMNSELNDNTARLMNETVGQGYQNAYSDAGRMFTSDQGRALEAQGMGEQSSQFGANYGLESLRQRMLGADQQSRNAVTGLNAERSIYGDQMDAGAVERGITSEGIMADQTQFNAERDNPYKQVQYMQSLLQGMPLAAQNYNYSQPSWLSEFGSTAGGISDLLTKLKGVMGGTTTPAPAPVGDGANVWMNEDLAAGNI